MRLSADAAEVRWENLYLSVGERNGKKAYPFIDTEAMNP